LSAAIVGGSTVVGHFIPLAPFFVTGSNVLLGAILAVILSGATLFAIGWYKAKLTLAPGGGKGSRCWSSD
jgi:VIT1/CCC1 family predicted Fe2+/Mn2+ transporter